MSVWHPSQQTGHTCKTARYVLRVEGIHPYHILTLQELHHPDFKKYGNFCTWFEDQFGNDIEEQPIIFFYVTELNYKIWNSHCTFTQCKSK